jgi:signal peptidase I
VIPVEAQPQRYDRPQSLPQPSGAKSSGSFLLAGVREIVGTVLPAILIALLIQLFLAQTTRIQSYSMEPTLYENQRLVIEKISYRLRAPERGEIVVIRPQDGDSVSLIKRVIGLPGETIAVHDEQVFIDGEPLAEPYLRVVTHGFYPPIRIPDDAIFVMGDNRDRSRDSRMFGPVSLEDLVGRAVLRYWPLPESGLF